MYVPPVEKRRMSRQAVRAHSMFAVSSAAFSHEAATLKIDAASRFPTGE